jgi:trimeric autotransporter adhesin
VNNANVSGVNFSSTAVPVLQLSPTSINFGTVRDFTTSAISTVTVRNIGGTTMSNISIAVTGTNAAEFAVASNTCGTTLAASASCTVSLQLTPQSPGARTASLTVTSNAANNPQSVALTGTGTMVSLSASSISFGSQTVRTTSLASTITMTNVGPGSLTITGITITGTNAGNFSQTNTCGTALAANANCTISVRFTPSARGSRSASLRIADSDPTSPQLVALSGTGL